MSNAGGTGPTENSGTRLQRMKAKLFRRRRHDVEPEVEPKPKDSLPTTIKELEALVWKVNADCLCDICSPELYARGKCLFRCHLRFDLHKNLVRNNYGFSAYQLLNFGPNDLYKTEAMHLARTAVQYLDRPWEYLNDHQLAARESLLLWLEEHPDVGEPTNEIDCEKLVSGAAMTSLWQCMNELFFGGEMSRTVFQWQRDIKIEGVDMGLGAARSSGSPVRTWKIRMDPSMIAGDFGSHSTLAIISTLLHEAVHIFIDRYGCHYCDTWPENLQAGWHARPWQLIAAKLEEVVPRLLGVPVMLDRFYSFLSCRAREDAPNVPSRHDMAVFAFSNVKLWSRGSEDVRELVDCTSKLFNVQPWRPAWEVTQQEGKLFRIGNIHEEIPEWAFERDDEGNFRSEFRVGRWPYESKDSGEEIDTKQGLDQDEGGTAVSHDDTTVIHDLPEDEQTKTIFPKQSREDVEKKWEDIQAAKQLNSGDGSPKLQRGRRRASM